MSADKQLWLLAGGGNGAGKSTFYRLFLASTGLPFVNADILAKELNAEQPKVVSYKVAKLAGKLCLDLLRTGTSFCFETVFSHPSKIDFLAAAKSAGYEIIFVYIHLQNDQLN
ncbi:MAG: dephospho-CoA kinase [Gammaproteobacteria bacterium]|nr:dephospho-CoA kinase [Gammaproteobacteria bacterium]MCF6259923.1 dephospho-CoA kinase [Gammaproteobacteria bacterium]